MKQPMKNRICFAIFIVMIALSGCGKNDLKEREQTSRPGPEETVAPESEKPVATEPAGTMTSEPAQTPARATETPRPQATIDPTHLPAGPITLPLENLSDGTYFVSFTQQELRWDNGIFYWAAYGWETGMSEYWDGADVKKVLDSLDLREEMFSTALEDYAPEMRGAYYCLAFADWDSDRQAGTRFMGRLCPLCIRETGEVYVNGYKYVGNTDKMYEAIKDVYADEGNDAMVEVVNDIQNNTSGEAVYYQKNVRH